MKLDRHTGRDCRDAIGPHSGPDDITELCRLCLLRLGAVARGFYVYLPGE